MNNCPFWKFCLLREKKDWLKTWTFLDSICTSNSFQAVLLCKSKLIQSSLQNFTHEHALFPIYNIEFSLVAKYVLIEKYEYYGKTWILWSLLLRNLMIKTLTLTKKNWWRGTTSETILAATNKAFNDLKQKICKLVNKIHPQPLKRAKTLKTSKEMPWFN